MSKLAALLEGPVDSECKVVYLLAEVRKLLERDALAHGMTTLKMFCHWALHVDLTYPSTTRGFLDRVDRWITNRVAYLTPREPWTIEEEHSLFEDFVHLKNFRDQLYGFLTYYELPAALCTDDRRWNRFLEEYSGVIEDGSLSINEKDNLLSAVEKVKFEKGAQLPAENHVPFEIRWTIYLRDGRIVKTTVSTTPRATGNVDFHSIELLTNGFKPPNDGK